MSHPTLEFKRAYLALRRALEQTIKPFGLSVGQFDVLQLLMHENDLEHREMQRQLGVASPTLTNILDGLERGGHVRRAPGGADARVKTVHMSPNAQRLCASDAFCEAGDALVERMFAGFTPEDRKRFANYLSRIQSNLAD